jgi:hypothetical protein
MTPSPSAADPPRKLSDQFRAIEALAARADPTLGALVEEMGARGPMLVILFLALPFCQPIPLLGLSPLFGSAIVITAAHLVFATRLWLPRRARERRLPASLVRAICQAFERVLAVSERYIRPRGRFLHANGWMVRLNGTLLGLAGAFLALPLPIPGTNIAPAWVILLICVGTLEEDGLLVALGYGAFAVGWAVVWLLLWPLFNWQQTLQWWGG